MDYKLLIITWQAQIQRLEAQITKAGRTLYAPGLPKQGAINSVLSCLRGAGFQPQRAFVSSNSGNIISLTNYGNHVSAEA